MKNEKWEVRNKEWKSHSIFSFLTFHFPFPTSPLLISGSGILQISSPITAAGPFLIFTGFPFNLNKAP